MIDPGVIIAERFEIIAELGRGGTAVVYRARDRVLGQDVALKFLHSHLAADSLMRDRLRREVKACRRLSHPHILPVFELHETPERLFLAMAYHPGATLREWVSEKGAFDAEAARKLGLDIADALEFAHLRGILHRDIKPENLLIDDDGRVQLTDFGFARLADLASMTASSQILGTPGYVAPEIYAGGRWEPRSDLYSVGAVLYEALTGRPPFAANSPLAVLQAQVSGLPPAPSAYNADVPPWLDGVVLSLLEVDPDNRPDGAGALRRALQQRTEPHVEVEGSRVERAASAPPQQGEPVAGPVQLAPEGAADTEMRGKEAKVYGVDEAHDDGVYQWLDARFEELGRRWAETREDLPRGLRSMRQIDPLFERSRMQRGARTIADTWYELGKVASGADRRRGRLRGDDRLISEPSSPHQTTWLRSVVVQGAADRSGRSVDDETGAPYRARMTGQESRRLGELLLKGIDGASINEDTLMQAGTAGAPLRVCNGLANDRAWELKWALEDAGFVAQVEPPSYRGGRLKLPFLLAPLMLFLLGLFVGQPLLLMLPGVAFVALATMTRPQPNALIDLRPPEEIRPSRRKQKKNKKKARAKAQGKRADAGGRWARRPREGTSQELGSTAHTTEPRGRREDRQAQDAPRAPESAPRTETRPTPPLKRQATPAGITWPTGWPARSGHGDQSRSLRLAYRTLARIAQIEQRLPQGGLPEPAVKDLRSRLIDVKGVCGPLVGVAMSLEQSLDMVNEADIVRSVGVLEQRQRRAVAKGARPSEELAASILAQRQLLDRLGTLDGELARYLARLMTLSATLDTLGVVLGRHVGGVNLDGLSEVAELVARMGDEVEAGLRLLDDNQAQEAAKALRQRAQEVGGGAVPAESKHAGLQPSVAEPHREAQRKSMAQVEIEDRG